MNNTRIKGVADQAKGSLKDATGKIIGNKQLQAEGKVDKVIGKAENMAGKLKDAARKDERDSRRP